VTTVDAGSTLELVRTVSFAGRGAIGPQELLDQVCGAVSATVGYDEVAAVRLRESPAERSGAAASAPPLVALALESDDRVLVSDPDADGISLFALPLLGATDCLGVLFGKRTTTAPPGAQELDGLATLGIVVSNLLENALLQEKAEQLDVLKSEFIALAAHELRSPLAGIYGACVTLDERGDDLDLEERLALAAMLRDQSTRMRNLIGQLLDLSRFDLVALPVSPERFLLRPWVEELVSTFPDVPQGAVTIAIPRELDAFVDPNALERMLQNLVANALRYGEPPVTVTAIERDTHLRLVVEDRGGGVPDEFVPRLFERFTRGSPSRGRGEGAGLGLAIVQAYARAHGGEIVYEPAEPRGAHFEVVLPVAASERRD
jgi:signal transduction histidine kinase